MLPTVEDNSVGSGSHASERELGNVNHHEVHSQQPKGLKRSNYISIMAGSTKESEDLVAMLSRPSPSPGGMGGALGSRGSGLGSADVPASPGGMGGGKSTFFDLKRSGPALTPVSPATSNTVSPASSNGGEFSDGTSGGDEGGINFHSEAGGGGGARVNPRLPPARSNSDAAGGASRPLQPSLRSALRMSSRAEMKASVPPEAAAEMRKNTSVTFSNTTKRASQLGFAGEQQGNARFNFPGAAGQGQGQGQGQGRGEEAPLFPQRAPPPPQSALRKSNYTAAMMMKKSQSIASPQFLLAHQDSISSAGTGRRGSGNGGTANESFSPAGGGDGAGTEGNASFPIFLSKLPGEEEKEQERQAKLAQQQKMNALRSKSMNTLKYVYQNPLQEGMRQDPGQMLLNAAGLANSRPSGNGLNLTFRDMLDEGDGSEGDLNLRSRNQRWKDFRTFSDRFAEDNPMMAAARAMEGKDAVEEGGAPVTKGGATSGTPPLAQGKSSAGSVETSSTSGTDGSNPLSGTKRASPANNSNFANAGPFSPLARMTLAGSHRAAVSVNDLAVLRRAASRMKMNGMPAAGGDAGGARRQSSTLRPGETLGGDLLSRMSSGSSGEGGRGGSDASDAVSPLAKMMAKNASLRSAGAAANGGAGRGGGGGDSFANSAQRDLFFQKFTLAMNNSSSSARLGDAAAGGGAHGPPPTSSSGMGGMAMGGTGGNMAGGMGGMGRRVRTVGAGLAYGRDGMTDSTLGNGFRLSRFDLGDLRKVSSRLSEVSSKGSVNDAGMGVGGGGGRNEEWDLS